MTSIESILNKGAAYTRFRVGVHVMQAVLGAAPLPLGRSELERTAGCSAWLLVRVCARLVQAGLLSPAGGTVDGWLPGPLADCATLADILCSEIAHRTSDRTLQQTSQQTGKRNTWQRRRGIPGHERNMDAFVMQATIGINQTVLAQLRRFPLRRAGKLAAAARNT